MTTSRPKALLLLSGGLDSTVAAFLCADVCEPVLALGFDYGQKAVRQELGGGYAVAQLLGVEHRTVALPFFNQMGRHTLTDPTRAIPDADPAGLDDVAAARETAAAVWVPNRNGVFLAIGAAWAEKIGADVLVVGFNAEEAATFPDNSAAFVERQNEALSYSTANGVRILAPTQDWTKTRIVEVARDRDLPLELVWSCYRGDDRPCGRCESCRRLDRALDEAGAREWYEARRDGRTRR